MTLYLALVMLYVFLLLNGSWKTQLIPDTYNLQRQFNR